MSGNIPAIVTILMGFNWLLAGDDVIAGRFPSDVSR